MITKQDLKTLEENVSKKIDTKVSKLEANLNQKIDSKVAKLEEDLVKRIDAKIEIRLEEKLNEKIGLLPTKEEFFNAMDQVMTELKTIRQEQVVISHRLSNHDRKFESLAHQ